MNAIHRYAEQYKAKSTIDPAECDTQGQEILFWASQIYPLPESNDLLGGDIRTGFIENYQADGSGCVQCCHFSLDKKLLTNVCEQTVLNNCSTQELMLSLYFVLLFKVSGVSDQCIAIPNPENLIVTDVYPRSSSEPLLPLRLSLSGDMTFGALVEMVQRKLALATEYNDVQFYEVYEVLELDCCEAQERLFDTVFLYENVRKRFTSQSDTIDFVKSSNPDRFMNFQVTECETGIHCTFKYSVATDASGKAASLSHMFENMLVTLGRAFGCTLDDLGNGTALEVSRVLEGFNATERKFNMSSSIDAAFQKNALINHHQQALHACDRVMTYAELESESSILALELTRSGVRPGDFVGILLERNSRLIVSLLAVLKCGAAYVPMDPLYPAGRLRHMLNDTGAVILISTGNLAQKVSFEGQIIDPMQTGSYSIEELRDYTSCQNKPNDVAYVIYTSGSTGMPKGVVVEHGNVLNFVESLHALLQLPEGSRVLGLTTASFDIFVLEVFLTLLKGHTLVLATEKEQTDPYALSDFISDNCTNVVQLTPSRLQVLAAGDIPLNQIFRGVNSLLVGGEAFPQNQLGELQNIPGLSIYNLYGPTETTVWSSLCNLTNRTDITLGKPIANTQMYVLDDDHKPLPIGKVGHLYIGGSGVARGYLNDEKKTKEVYRDNPFRPGERMYNTGDLAAWTADGELTYCGRSDSQIKHLGYRIDLVEIDTAMNKCEGVNSGCVAVRELGKNNFVLVAFCTSSEKVDNWSFTEKIKQQLKGTLPRYMVPDYIVRLDALPLTPNSKIDRSQLPDRIDLLEKLAQDNYPMDNISIDDQMKFLRECWTELLNSGSFAETTSFFDAGGNSYSLVLLHKMIEARYPGAMEVADMFANPTLDSLHAALVSSLTQNESVEIPSTAGESYLKIVFPDRYFVSPDKLQKPEYFRFSVKHETWLMLEELQKSHKTGMTDSFIGLLALFVNKVIGCDRVVLQKRKDRELLYCEFDFEKILTVDDLLYRSGGEFYVSTGQTVLFGSGCDHVEVQHSREISIVFDGEAGEASLTGITSRHDLVLTLDEHTESIRVDFNHRHLDAGQVYRFTADYIKMMDNLVPSIHSTIH